MCKAICGVAAGACGGAINLHWAKGSDISDINAKFGAQVRKRYIFYPAQCTLVSFLSPRAYYWVEKSTLSRAVLVSSLLHCLLDPSQRFNRQTCGHSIPS